MKDLRIGVLTPHAAPGPEYELPAMVPGLVTRVARIPASGIATTSPPTTPPALRALTATSRVQRAAETLRVDGVDAVVYASTTTGYAIGFDAEAALASRLATSLAVPVVATCTSAVRALRTLGVDRVQLIGAPWFESELNELGAVYFRSQGFDVVCSRSAELAHDPSQIDAAAVYEWTSRHVEDEAEAVFIGGNGFRAAGAIQAIEHAIGRPVLASNQALLWNILVHVGAHPEIHGYGRLFTHPAIQQHPRDDGA